MSGLSKPAPFPVNRHREITEVRRARRYSPRMISVEGAAVIAQVLPVALLIIAFEGKAPAKVMDHYKVPHQVRLALVFSVWAVIAVAAWGLVLCILSVASRSPIEGAAAILVAFGGFALGALALGYVGLGVVAVVFSDVD